VRNTFIPLRKGSDQHSRDTSTSAATLCVQPHLVATEVHIIIVIPTEAGHPLMNEITVTITIF
jgi:hypothetical protein